MTKPKQPEHANELVTRAKEGNRAALDPLLEYGWKFMRWYATRPTLRVPTRPSDVGGNATLRMVRSFGSFNGTTINEFEGWLIAIVTNEAKGSVRVDKRRKNKAHAIAMEENVAAEQNQEAQKTPSANVAASDDWHALYSAIHGLPKNQSKAVYLKLLQERSINDIAKIMRKTPTAIDGLIQRGLKALRVHFAPGQQNAARKTTRAERAALRTGLSEYLRRIDRGEDVEITSFVAEHAPGGESLHEMLEWVRYIRAIGGNES